MKNLFTFYLLLYCSFSLTAQLRLKVEGDGRINGRLELNSSGITNMFIGQLAGEAHTTGTNNIFIGNSAGFSNRTGSNNLFIGPAAGSSNTSGSLNTFLGYFAGFANNLGIANTFIGTDAGTNNKAGVENTFLGQQAGLMNIDGDNNTFIGEDAGRNNNGSRNTFVGSKAGSEVGDDLGQWNTYIGYQAGQYNEGDRNIIIGTGFSNESGGLNSNNTIMGWGAATIISSGSSNVIIGSQAGGNNKAGQRNTFVGRLAGFNNVTGSELVAIGYNANPSLMATSDINNAFVLGNNSLVTARHSGVLGNISLQKITGYVNWGTASDGRMKKAVKEDIKGLDFILQLRPVSYQVDALKLDRFLRQGMEDISAAKDGQSDNNKKQIQERQQTYEGYLREKSAIRYTGFIAQEVEKAMGESGFEFSGLVQPAHDKDHYSLRYAEFVVPLVKGMQEQQEIIETQRVENEEQEQAIEKLQSEVKELKNLLQQFLTEKQDEPKGELYQLDLKQKAMLAQNRPNPFLGQTIIDYFIPGDVQKALIQVTSADGKILGQIMIKEPGKGQVNINTGTYAAGTYFYSLILDGKPFETKRMVLTK